MIKYFIFDIDGTLANCHHRRHHVEGDKKDFRQFYAEMLEDSPNIPVVKVAQSLYGHGYGIIIVTGRPEVYRIPTVEWLVKAGVPYHALLMRPTEKWGVPDSKTKQEILKELQETIGMENIVAVFDDRPRVVEMWREAGLTVFQLEWNSKSL